MKIQFLQDHKGDKSSMRLSLILVAIGVFTILLSVAGYIIIAGFKETSPAWGAMGGFAAGVATILTGTLYTKTLQKETELKHEKDE